MSPPRNVWQGRVRVGRATVYGIGIEHQDGEWTIALLIVLPERRTDVVAEPGGSAPRDEQEWEAVAALLAGEAIGIIIHIPVAQVTAETIEGQVA